MNWVWLLLVYFDNVVNFIFSIFVHYEQCKVKENFLQTFFYTNTTKMTYLQYSACFSLPYLQHARWFEQEIIKRYLWSKKFLIPFINKCFLEHNLRELEEYKIMKLFRFGFLASFLLSSEFPNFCDIFLCCLYWILFTNFNCWI